MTDTAKAQLLLDAFNKADHRGTGRPPDSLIIAKAIEELDADADTIAAAIVMNIERNSQLNFEVRGEVLAAFLQKRLTFEHVVAQRKMARAAGLLGHAAYAIAGVSVVLAAGQAFTELPRWIVAVAAGSVYAIAAALHIRSTFAE